MRLIDADALREVLETAVQINPITQKYNKEDVIRAIMDAPTIAHGTDSIMIKWTPDIDKLARDVAFRGLNEFSFLGKSIMEWVEIILEQPRWISVKDRLPEKEGRYLCWFGKNTVAIGAAIATYLEEWKAFGSLASLETYPNVTHWMPLPEPPEDT